MESVNQKYMSLNSNAPNLQLKVSKPASFHYEVMEAHVLKHECFQGVEFEDEQISVEDGLLTVKPGFQWRSFSMGFHAPLVFLGLARMGVIDKVFVYGQPWTIEHSLLRAVLLQYSGTLGVDRARIDAIYAQGLVDAKVPLRGLWTALARWFGPRGA